MRNQKQLAEELSVAAVRLTRLLRANDTGARLSGPQASALSAIIYSGGLSPSNLADLEKVQRPTIAKTIGELEQQCLIERRADPKDGRGAILVATEKGHVLWTEGQARAIEPLVKSIARLTGADRATLDAAIPIIGSLMDA